MLRRGRTSHFIRTEDGAALVYTLIALPVMVGLVGFAFDMSRAMVLNTELQDLADAAAIAGAMEMDRSASACARARTAAATAVTNAPSLAEDGAPEVALSAVRFWTDNPASGGTEVCGSGTEANSGSAGFIEVVASPRSTRSLFIRAVLPGAADISNSARAVATRQQVACAVTPMMMCNPVTPAVFTSGKMYALKQQGPGASLGPGAFALLDPPGTRSSGANLTSLLLASENPGFCFINTTSVATGSRAGPVSDGINVRFDMYPNAANSDLNDFAPAPNVTKGTYYQQPCRNPREAKNATDLMPFPFDDCFLTGTCTVEATNRLGTGNWDRAAYWTRNHSSISAANRPSGWNTWSRYQTYLWELDLMVDPDDPDGLATLDGEMPSRAGAREDPAPSCFGGEDGGPERRIMYIAVADCTGISGNSTPDLEAARFAKMFLVRPSFAYDHPVTGANNFTQTGEVLTEFVEWVEPGDDSGVLRNIVQLVE